MNRTRTKVYCYCKKCNGSLVDPRTKIQHSLKFKNYQEGEPFIAGSSNVEPSDAGPSNVEPSSNAGPSDAGPSNADSNTELSDAIPTFDDDLYNEMKIKSNNFFLTKKLHTHESAKSKKGKISDLVLENLLLLDDESEDDDYHDQDSEDEGDDDEEEEEEEGMKENVDFSSTEFDDNEPKLRNINSNYSFIWIIF